MPVEISITPAPTRQLRPLWSAPELAALLSIHHLTLLKKAQGCRGNFEIPAGGFKLGRLWRWRDEDVQAFLLRMSGATELRDGPSESAPKQIKKRPGRPRGTARAGDAA
jgi:hypothetical protein